MKISDVKREEGGGQLKNIIEFPLKQSRETEVHDQRS